METAQASITLLLLLSFMSPASTSFQPPSSSFMSSTTPTMMFTTDFGFMNGTEDFTDDTPYSEAHYLTVLKAVQKWLLTAILVCTMLAMGAVITVNDFKETFRRPVGFIIGFVSQFVTMPLFCFLTALALDLEPPFALGLLIIGCCPGGTVSNLFTFWTNGDVCLSVCMTTISCTAAIGMMPLNLLIYSRRWTSEKTTVPFINIFTTLVTMIVPAAAGMVVRRYSLKWANRVSQVGSIAGLVCIPISITLIGIVNPGMFTSSWKIWTSTAVLPLVGYSFGYGVGRILHQPTNKCRTIGFETGVQNAALAIAIMLLTFANTPLLYDMLTVPCFYGTLCFADFLVYVAFYQIRMYYGRRNQPQKMEEEDEEEGEGDRDEDCYHGNDNQFPDKPRNEYKPIKITADTDVIPRMTGNEEDEKQVKNVEEMDYDIKIIVNGDYHVLESK